MKKNPTPTILQDDFKIFCVRLRRKGLAYEMIGKLLGKDRSTIYYQISKYNDLMEVDKTFQRKNEEFDQDKFLRKYYERKPGKREKIKLIQRELQKRQCIQEAC